MNQIKATDNTFENDLIEIQNWDIKDTPGLLHKMKQLFYGGDKAFVQTWTLNKNNKQQPLLTLEIHTGGLSNNEQIIDALKSNKLFFTMWWSKTERGGHYYFEIDFNQIGYKLVSEYCLKHNVSRQYISQNKKKFDWIVISANKKLIRIKAEKKLV